MRPGCNREKFRCGQTQRGKFSATARMQAPVGPVEARARKCVRSTCLPARPPCHGSVIHISLRQFGSENGL